MTTSDAGLDRAIELAGGKAFMLAALLGVHPSTVSSWRTRGVPPMMVRAICDAIREKKGRRLRPEELRPDVFGRPRKLREQRAEAPTQ
jgi:DNA-binding transcriptional regulator YdaS (Cro superfamily)